MFKIWYKENTIKEKSSIVNLVVEKENIVEKIEPPIWSETEDGYSVIAKLEIPSIDLMTNVLSEYSENAMLVSVTKFWGANPNQIGNCCIIGHNYYKRKNMFYNLKDLNIGDEILLTDTSNLTIMYEIYSIIKVEPTDTSCLSQNTKSKREITLITCTSNSKKRIIIKAVEKRKI